MASDKQAHHGLAAALRSTSIALAVAALAACGGGGGGDTAAASTSLPADSTTNPAGIGTPVSAGAPSAGGSGSSARSGTASTGTTDGSGTTSTGTAAGGGTPASAGGTTAPATPLQRSDFVVNTTTAGDQEAASMAPLAGGGHAIVWTSATTSPQSEVRLQRVDAQGHPVGAETLVATLGNTPRVAAFPGGGFIVTWSASPSIYEANAYAQRFGADGAPVGGQIVLAQAFFNYSVRPLALPDGSLLIAADTIDGKYGAGYATVRRHAADGTPLGTATRLTSELTQQTTAYSPNAAFSATPALLADGRIAVAWVATGTAVGELRLSVFDQAGAPLGGFRTVASDPTIRAPAIAALPGGGHALAWQTSTSVATPDPVGAGRRLWLETFDAAGNSLGRRMVLDDPLGVDLGPRLAALADGSLVLAWTSVHDTATGDVVRQVATQRFTAAGAAAGTVEQISSVTASPNPVTYASGNTVDVAPEGAANVLVLYGRWSAANGWDVGGAIR
ncbi:MAG: hypothetical protein ACXWC2_15400 [Ramlibacter sp.]